MRSSQRSVSHLLRRLALTLHHHQYIADCIHEPLETETLVGRGAVVGQADGPLT